MANVSAESQDFNALDLDAYLYLASVKSHLTDHKPMTLGDEAAWAICDWLQMEAA